MRLGQLDTGFLSSLLKRAKLAVRISGVPSGENALCY